MEIPISLSAIKRIGQRFETKGNVVRKKGSGRPKASSCRDDHLLKFTVRQDRKRSLTKSVSRIQDLRKQDSFNEEVSRRCVKNPLLSVGWQSMESLIQSGSAELCGVMNQYFSCMLTSREVCSKIW